MPWPPGAPASPWLTCHAHVLPVCVQELQCDVSVEEDSRQEWTFTLYDFDNNGKVTREVSAPGPGALFVRLAAAARTRPPPCIGACP